MLPEGSTTLLVESSAGSFAFLDVRYEKSENGLPWVSYGVGEAKGQSAGEAGVQGLMRATESTKRTDGRPSQNETVSGYSCDRTRYRGSYWGNLFKYFLIL